MLSVAKYLYTHQSSFARPTAQSNAALRRTATCYMDWLNVLRISLSISQNHIGVLVMLSVAKYLYTHRLLYLIKKSSFARPTAVQHCTQEDSELRYGLAIYTCKIISKYKLYKLICNFTIKNNVNKAISYS